MNKKELTRAYCNTSYRVRVSPEPIRLRVGERSAAFDEVLNSYGVTHWAFITAYNPRSRQLSDEENRRRHRDLLRKVKSINCQTLACEAKGDDGAWPAEEGLIVLDIPEDVARALGREFGQNAILTGRRGEPSELSFLNCDGDVENDA